MRREPPAAGRGMRSAPAGDPWHIDRRRTAASSKGEPFRQSL
ncbi:hypothetical protein [Actinoplanes sp. G11-F43]